MKTHPGTNIPIDRKNNEQNARHFNVESDSGVLLLDNQRNETRSGLPMAEFSNALNDIYPEVTHENWRSLREWKMFVAGYNAAISAANASIKAKYNMGLIPERLFGQK